MPANSDSCNYSLVDWNSGELRVLPRKARPDQRETVYPVRCANPDCGLVRWLTASAARKAEAERRICRRCQCVMAGKRGFAVTAATYGEDFALRAVRQYQLNHPSHQERIVGEWLADLDVYFDRQVEFVVSSGQGRDRHFFIDFVIYPDRCSVGIEVNGYHHKLYRADRDALLRTVFPGELIFLDTDDIDADPDAVRQHLIEFLK